MPGRYELEQIRQIPGIDSLAAIVHSVVDLSGEAVRQVLVDHKELTWDTDDQVFVDRFEEFSRRCERLRAATGWGVHEMLEFIGCRQQGGELTSEHLGWANARIDLASAAVDDFLALGDRETVSSAFRSPPGDVHGPLRSMTDQPWRGIYADAQEYLGAMAYGDGPDMASETEVDRALDALAMWRRADLGS